MRETKYDYVIRQELQYADEFANGQWDMFRRISTKWYGTQVYFLREDGLIYSENSKKNLTFGKAYEEFISLAMEN